MFSVCLTSYMLFILTGKVNGKCFLQNIFSRDVLGRYRCSEGSALIHYRTSHIRTCTWQNHQTRISFLSLSFSFRQENMPKERRNVNQLPCKLSSSPFGPSTGPSNFLEIYLLSMLFWEFPAKFLLKEDKSDCL